MNLDSRYGYYFPEYCNYFGRPLVVKKSMYVMTNYVNIFDNELNNWLIYEEVFKQLQCKISIYYKYESDGSNLFVLSYVNDCVYWYTYDGTGNWFVDTIGKRFHVNFIGYQYWFMYIRVS